MSAWACYAIPAATERRCGHVNDAGQDFSGILCCEHCGCTKAASDDRKAREANRLLKQWRQAAAKSARAVEVRSSLPPGSTRARVTTANARWMRAAEERDRLAAQLISEHGITPDGEAAS